ncbi:MAG: type II secretion system protein [Vulcanimicrobiota bacterium]
MRKSKRALSILELVVAAGIFSLVTTLVLGFLVQSGRWTREIQAYQGAEQDLHSGLERIVKEFSQAPRMGAVAFYPSGDPDNGDLHLAWTSPYDEDGNYFQDPLTFNPVYQGCKIYYHDPARRTLLSTYLAHPPTDLPVRPLVTTIQAALDPDADRPRIREVASFQLLHPDSLEPIDQLFNPSRLRLVLNSKGGREQSLVLNREVRFAY